MTKTKNIKQQLKDYMLELTEASEGEIEEHIKQLTDDEVGVLITLCEEQIAYEEAISEEARKIDPEKYDREEKEFRQKLLQIDLDAIDDMEKIQEGYDAAMDEEEEKYKKTVMSGIEDRKQLLDELEKTVDEGVAMFESEMEK